MKHNTQQYKDAQAQANNTVRTYVRPGWIPTVVHMPYRENRNWEMERQPQPYQGPQPPRSRNTRRKYSWVAWPEL